MTTSRSETDPGAIGPPPADRARPGAGVEECRWRLPSGYATLRYPSTMTDRDLAILVSCVQLLRASFLGQHHD